MTERAKVEGIKLSNELVAVNFRNLSDSDTFISHFCQLLALNQINMPFLSVTRMDKRVQLSCCVSVEDEARLRDILQSESLQSSVAECISTVGLLSIFPHQFGMGILGLALYALGKARLPIYGLATSIAALTFVMDYSHLNKAVESLQKYLEIPTDQIFVKPEIRVTQIDPCKK